MNVEIALKSYDGKAVLDGISLAVAPGEVVALTGPSGVGKSTLARIVAGIDTRFTGSVEGVGRVGMVFQEPTLLPWRSLADNLTIATGCTAAEARAMLGRVELGERHGAFPAQLSLGQQRRVALARALAAQPQTLIFDEALTSLDEATANRMKALIAALLAGSTHQTLIVTHNLDHAVELADRVLLLDGSPARFCVDHRFATPRGKRDVAGELAILREHIREAGAR